MPPHRPKGPRLPKRPLTRPRRCFALEYLGENQARFECPEGHHFTSVVIKQIVRGARTWSDEACEMMVKWWRREAGGVSMVCLVCEREAKRAREG